MTERDDAEWTEQRVKAAGTGEKERETGVRDEGG